MESSSLLDFDPCYKVLKQPVEQYRAIVEEGVSEQERRFIAERLSRDQLTGGGAFTDEIEKKKGIRIEARTLERTKNKPATVYSKRQ